MAKRYARYLQEEMGVVKRAHQNLPLSIDVVGAVRRKKSVLGLPVELVEPLTTYLETERLLEELRTRGVDDIVLRYRMWFVDGIKEMLATNVRYPAAMGGRSGFQDLLSYSECHGIALYPDADLVSFSRNGNGYNGTIDSAVRLSRVPARQYSYMLSTYFRDQNTDPSFLLAGKLIEKASDRFLSSYRKLGIPRIGLSFTGAMLYSDFRKERFARSDTKEAFTDILGQYAGSVGDILVAGGNAYALPYTSFIIDAPTDSSHFDIEDETVPFFQLVLRGLIPFAGPSINHSSYPEVELLRAVETGASLHFTFVAEDPSILTESKYNDLYASYYPEWIDLSTSQYLRLKTIGERIGDSAISSHHRIQDGVYETVFANGVFVMVNYNREPVNLEGLEISGLDFVLGVEENRQ
jgi:hypothetical protein